MTYDVQFSRRAEKDLIALSRDDQIRVLKKIQAAAEDPARFFMPLKGVRAFRMRVGDLRVIAEVVDEVILVAKIGKRSNIYK